MTLFRGGNGIRVEKLGERHTQTEALPSLSEVSVGLER